MSSYRRNLLVGVTVLGALAVLGWMILKFGGALAGPFAPAQVYIEISVDAVPPLPANLKGVIRPNGLIGGGSSVVLELDGDQPLGALADKSNLNAAYSGLDLLPPQFAELATELTRAAKQFRESNVIMDADATVKHIGVLSDSLQKIAGDAGTQGDLKAAIENIRQTSEDVKRFSKTLAALGDNANSTIAQAHQTLAKADSTLDTLSHQVGDRLQQAATLITQLNAITDKVNKGQGTAGALVNDPKLYRSLVDTTQEMDATVKDLKRLVEQWEQEGVHLHLN